MAEGVLRRDAARPKHGHFALTDGHSIAVVRAAAVQYPDFFGISELDWATVCLWMLEHQTDTNALLVLTCYKGGIS
jgi:hypothetical protein